MPLFMRPCCHDMLQATCICMGDISSSPSRPQSGRPFFAVAVASGGGQHMVDAHPPTMCYAKQNRSSPRMPRLRRAASRRPSMSPAARWQSLPQVEKRSADATPCLSRLPARMARLRCLFAIRQQKAAPAEAICHWHGSFRPVLHGIRHDTSMMPPADNKEESLGRMPCCCTYTKRGGWQKV